MRTVKFVLINPASETRRVQLGKKPRGSRFFRFSMLTSLYVAASMPRYVETQIIDEEVEGVDFDIEADLIGISFMTYNAPRAYAIAEEFRHDRGKPVIFGGYHPTFMPDEAIQHADAVCIGEAESNLPQMMDDFTNGKLKPFYSNELPDLCGLPRPNSALICKRAYAPVDVIQATRGCPHQCSFCSVSSFHHHRFRTRPVGEVIDELKSLGRMILFMDDSLNASREYAKELFTAMIPLKKRWFSQSSVRIVEDDELLELVARSGCKGLFIGFETLSDTGLSSWNKRLNLGRDYLEVVRKLHEKGIAICAAFVFGGDSDTPAAFEQTLEFLLESNVETVQATRMTPFPGTPLFNELDQQGRILDRNWAHYDFNNVVFEPRHMSRETLEKGVSWVLREFHARKRVLRRVWNCSRYLSPGFVLTSVLPINFGWRDRLTAEGNFERGLGFSSNIQNWERL